MNPADIGDKSGGGLHGKVHCTMKIGVSIPVRLLLGEIGDGTVDMLEEIFGSTEAALEAMRGWGVTHVELRNLTPDTSSDELAEACAVLEGAGMGATMHATTPGEPLRLEDAFPALVPCLERAVPREPVVITFHASRGEPGTEAECARRTAAILAQLAEDVATGGLPVRLALENNRAGDLADPGATCAGVTAVLHDLDSEIVGACWDFGHMWGNLVAEAERGEPPDDFLRRVIHAHVHDFDDTTHQPLTRGNVPVARWAGFLELRDYDGIYNLELNTGRYEDDIRSSFEQSVRILREAVTQARSRPRA